MVPVGELRSGLREVLVRRFVKSSGLREQRYWFGICRAKAADAIYFHPQSNIQHQLLQHAKVRHTEPCDWIGDRDRTLHRFYPGSSPLVS